MIIFSIIAYIGLSAWYLFGSEKNQRISSIIGVVISSFFAYWHWDIDNLAMAIYIITGIICIFFHWISVNETQTTKPKSKAVAVLFAFFLGGYGTHRFYLRKPTSALLYVLFCWTMIPGVIGIIEAIYLLTMSRDKFNSKYNSNAQHISEHERRPKSTKQSSHSAAPKAESVETEDISYTGVNERDGENLNYRDLRLCGYRAEAVGTVENFTITVRSSGKTYTFKSKDGDICSYRSSTMRETRHYEVT